MRIGTEDYPRTLSEYFSFGGNLNQTLGVNATAEDLKEDMESITTIGLIQVSRGELD